jgi:D-alanyl-D-alanine carboxypeptidase
MKEMQSILLEQVSGNNSPSVQYILFDKDSIIKRYSFGLANIKDKKEVDENTTYNAYSVTKTFTALAILQLAEQKKLDIEQPINKYLPDFPYNSDITIRQILTHSAGIPNPIPLSWIHLPSEHKSFDRNQFFKNIFTKNNTVRSSPNEKYAYSNLGYVLLGQLIEKVSGINYEEYININTIKKLGIEPNELGFEIDEATKHATGYHKRLSFFNSILGFFIDKSKYMEKVESQWKPFKYFYVNGVSYGGLIGTPDAFMKYIQELLKPNCQLITNDYKQMLFTENYTNNKKATGMCLSWFSGELNGEKYFAHPGGGGGYYCEIRIYPDLGLGSVVFFNRTGMSDERFLDKVDEICLKNNATKLI